jgi:hypothetical protein
LSDFLQFECHMPLGSFFIVVVCFKQTTGQEMWLK